MADKSHLTKLSFASLDLLADGQVGDAVNEALQSAITDLKNWGKDGKIRKVVLELGIVTKKATGRAKVTVNVKVLLPTDKPKATLAELSVERAEPELLFNATSANNPDQQVLFDRVEGP